MLHKFLTYVTLSNIKDLVTIFTLLIGAYVALKGLKAWKTQLKGNQDYNLAKSMSLNLRKYIESLHQFRHPAIWGGEYPEFTEEELKAMSYKEKHHKEISNAYQKRWDHVIQKKIMLQENLLESQVIWEKDLTPYFQQLFKLEFQLVNAISRYIETLKPSPTHHAVEKTIHDLVWDQFDDDPFRTKLAPIVTSIEGYIKPHLKLK
ncbi:MULTISPECIES: hypothetical protein [unclassified Legionella]|uniref:hypothetical protein n=1 Tax=unclassified Legionella TaxID=2622702 RepID=UPI003AF6E9B8